MMLCCCLLLCLLVCAASALQVDPNGYIVYCPCMGRFGNQAEHFLGTLAFARGLDRTLVLPPWVEFRYGQPRSTQIAFDTYIAVKPLTAYHRVITMEDFMKKLAPKIWPPSERTVYCYSSRTHGNEPAACNAKDGNPFGPFWDTFNIDFVRDEFYSPLYYNTDNPEMKQQWNQRFPVDKHPVLAFTGAPASFPARKDHIPLQKYVKWSNSIDNQAQKFIARELERPYVGIHLRNGMDFNRACEHLDEMKNMFASAQCLGYHNEYGTLSRELCFPAEKTVLNQLKKTAKKIKAKSIFIATDNDPMTEKIAKHLKSLKVKLVTGSGDSPHLDLAILEKSDHYICNCVSSFSAFVTRMRKVSGKPTSFWAFQSGKTHDEL